MTNWTWKRIIAVSVFMSIFWFYVGMLLAPFFPNNTVKGGTTEVEMEVESNHKEVVDGKSDSPVDLVADADSATEKDAIPYEYSHNDHGTDVMVQFVMHRNYKIYPELAREIVEYAKEFSKEYSIPLTILLAIMDIESDYRYDAVSKSEALGLMQVHAPTWLDKDNKLNLYDAGLVTCKKELFSPKHNIRAGTYILNLYMQEGMRKGVDNPVHYAATRYFGGTKNTYYQKLISALGEFQVFGYTVAATNTDNGKEGEKGEEESTSENTES